MEINYFRIRMIYRLKKMKFWRLYEKTKNNGGRCRTVVEKLGLHLFHTLLRSDWACTCSICC